MRALQLTWRAVMALAWREDTAALLLSAQAMASITVEGTPQAMKRR